MKFYLREDLRYDYERKTRIYKAIIALLIMVCVVLIIVISNNDRAMKNNLIQDVSIKNSQKDAYEQTSEKEVIGYTKDEETNKSSLINDFCENFIAFVSGKKNNQIKTYFSDAFKTIDAEDVSFEVSKENCRMDCLSIRYADDQVNTVATDTDSKNDEQNSKAEKYLYLIKHKYKYNSKNDYIDQKFDIKKENIKNNSLKTLTVLSS